MNEMQKTPVDPNPKNNSLYKNVQLLQEFLTSLYIPTKVYVTNYAMMAQYDEYTDYYLDKGPETLGNFMVLGTYGQQYINVANFVTSISGYVNYIEKYRAIYNTFVGGTDFYGWLFNFDWFRESADTELGSHFPKIK